jgi:MarR family transcriptional regulator, organic hydroperoxide resistance regulator
MKKKYRSGGTLVNQIGRSCGHIFRKMLCNEGLGSLTEGQGRVIYALHEAPDSGISCHDLGTAAGFDKATLSSILDRMEESGLVARIPSPDDKRSILVVPGPSYPENIGRTFGRISSNMTELFYGDMTETERDQTDELLGRLLENCRKQE